MVAKHLLAAAAALTLSAAAHAQNVNFVVWGGGFWQESLDKSIAKPFTAKTKIGVNVDNYSGGLAQLRSQIQTGNVTWDVLDMQTGDAVRACDEGLLEKLPVANLLPGKDGSTPANDYLPEGTGECLAGSIIWSTLLSYDKSKYTSAPPSKVADFFDLKKYPGKRGLRKSPEGAMEWALLADGVKPDEVYKVLGTAAGVARAFKKLDTIKSSVVWWEAGSQPPQLLADGEVVMTGAWFSHIYSAISKGKKPFEFIWDGQLKNGEGFVIPKGAPHLKEAKEFIKFATASEQLAALASITAYGPTRKSANSLVDPKVTQYLPTNPKNLVGAVSVDFNFWADHADDLNQKFAAWLARK